MRFSGSAEIKAAGIIKSFAWTTKIEFSFFNKTARLKDEI
jgi:hypothetical protein